MSVISKVNSTIQVLLRFVDKYSFLDEIVAKIIESEECTKVLFHDNYLDVKCLKIAILGYAMTMFACLYKLPVILKILKKKGGDGLSIISVYLETCGYAAAVTYNFRRQNHISTYGDICAALTQNFIIILLIWTWGSNGIKISTIHKLGALITASILLFSVFQLPDENIKYITMFSTSVIIFSRLPQIISNAVTGNIGVQSIITLFNATLGAILKAWIYYNVKDFLQVGGALIAFSLNAILFGQFLYLGGLKGDNKKVVTMIKKDVSENTVVNDKKTRNLRQRRSKKD